MASTAEDFAARLPDAGQLLSDEPEMESSWHYQQLALLVSILEYHWQARDDFFIGANLTVYYALEELRQRRFRGPDFFLVTGVRREQRNSWVVWAEGGQYPELIIELLSASTASVDRGEKKLLYQNTFRTPEYFWFSPENGEFAGFRHDGRVYQPIPLDSEGCRESQVLDLRLGPVEGWLRYFDGDRLLPTPAEAAQFEREQAASEREQAERERERAESERERADTEHQRAELLAAKLRALGVDPDQL